ncbi:MAG TPA: ComEC/Rec2 family competence protein, partial [candidate division Zixibacteria bacterium]|nr:ComEC/Rec2 family competence protein [candidate division Zixibacteria bacterium]
MARAYPGIFLLIALAGGILAADFLRASAPAFLLAALGGLVAAAAALVFRRPSAAAVFFGLVLAGLSAAHFARDTYDLGSRSLGRYADSRTRYRLVGRVDDWPELRPDRIELTVRLDSLGPDRMAAVEGRLLLRIADTGAAVQFGDRVELSTRLYPAAERGEGAASRRSLLVKGVGALAYVRASQDVRRLPRPAVGLIPVVDTVRAAIGQSLRRTLSPRAAALAGGFLIGDTRDIPPDLYRAFRDSGTLHVLAVSGSNVAVVVGFVLVLLRPFRTGRVARTLILLVVVVFFALLCRGEPSVVRASVMAALILLARLAGRRIDLNNLVALAAAAILLCAPAQLFSVGFQLSFATAWGLVFVTPRVYRLLEGRALGPPARWLSLAVIVSLTAQLFSAPLVACYFHRVPLLGPAANLVIVPLVSAAVVGVLATLTLDFVWPPLGALAGALVDRLMDLILGALGLFSGERAPVLDTGALPPAAAVAAYAALIVAGFALGSLPVRRRAVLGGLVLLNGALAWLALGPRPPRVVCDIHITR